VGSPLASGITANVRRQARCFLFSPTTMTFETKSESSFLSLSSMRAGGMFSPPEVIISSLKMCYA